MDYRKPLHTNSGPVYNRRVRNFRNSRSMQSITEPDVAVSRSFSPLTDQSRRESRQQVGKENRSWCFASFPCTAIWAKPRLGIRDRCWRTKGLFLFLSLLPSFLIQRVHFSSGFSFSLRVSQSIERKLYVE